MTFLALLIALIALGFAVMSFSKTGQLNARLYEATAAMSSLKYAIQQFDEVMKQELASLRVEVKKRSGGIVFTADTTIEDVLKIHPQGKEVLASFRLVDCSECEVKGEDTLAEAARGYGVDLEKLLTRLNEPQQSGTAPMAK